MSSASHLRRRLALAGTAGLLAAGGAGAVLSTSAHGAAPPSEKVATTGNDNNGNNCTKTPCSSINYAIGQATAGETINIAKGTYHQTVDVTKSVRLVGAGAGKTIIDGEGLDPSSSGYYGVVYIGNAGGAVVVDDLTVDNPADYATTGGAPMAIVAEDGDPGDQVSIINDDLVYQGPSVVNPGTTYSDPGNGSDFPIGIYTEDNQAATTISGDTISGFFQGALLEDNSGAATINSNKFTDLISNSDGTTTYPAEGLFFLADSPGTYSSQDATGNTFSGYGGYGIKESAGYTGGYVTSGCVANGSIQTALSNNTFALTGGLAAPAISLSANGTGNDLSGTVTGNKGYTTSPGTGMEIASVATEATPQGVDCTPYSTSNGGGGTLDVMDNNNAITTKSPSTGGSAQAQTQKLPPLHIPHIRTHHRKH